MIIIVTIFLFAGGVFADSPCSTTSNKLYQRVAVFRVDGTKTDVTAYVYIEPSKRDSYRICWTHLAYTEYYDNSYDYALYNVYSSDKEDYKYMFWYEDGEKYYFNM